jgi:hypothetical protein
MRTAGAMAWSGRFYAGFEFGSAQTAQGKMVSLPFRQPRAGFLIH